ncbi:MAG: hypothetical protein RL333_725 [Pseudomonadota bacterium]|jgi:hypothetical protein
MRVSQVQVPPLLPDISETQAHLGGPLFFPGLPGALLEKNTHLMYQD